jgi:L-amino acid N-acyltransferase YncA
MSIPLRRIRKASDLLASRGLGGLMRLLGERLSPQPYHLYRLDLAGEAWRRLRTPTTVQRGDLHALRAWRKSQRRVPMPFRRDHADGWARFHWTWVEGEPAGIVWTVTDSPFVRIGPDERVIAGLYTVPSRRARGIGHALVAAACNDLAPADIRCVYASIHESNTTSRKLFESLGFQSRGVRNLRGFFFSKVDPRDWSTVPAPVPANRKVL